MPREAVDERRQDLSRTAGHRAPGRCVVARAPSGRPSARRAPPGARASRARSLPGESPRASARRARSRAPAPSALPPTFVPRARSCRSGCDPGPTPRASFEDSMAAPCSGPGGTAPRPREDAAEEALANDSGESQRVPRKARLDPAQASSGAQPTTSPSARAIGHHLKHSFRDAPPRGGSNLGGRRISIGSGLVSCAEVEDPALRGAILDFFEDPGAGQELHAAASAGRLVDVVGPLAHKEEDPERRGPHPSDRGAHPRRAERPGGP